MGGEMWQDVIRLEANTSPSCVEACRRPLCDGGDGNMTTAILTSCSGDEIMILQGCFFFSKHMHFALLRKSYDTTGYFFQSAFTSNHNLVRVFPIAPG